MRAEDIESEYQRRLAAHPEARWGWSFMYTPEAALERARVVLVGLNPGGAEPDPGLNWEHTGVNAYVDQPWGDDGLTPLQQQVGFLFDALGVQPADVFAANFTPFRSPNWKQLPDKEGALAFGRRLWTGLLSRTPARLFVTLGKQQSGQELATLLEAGFVKQHGVDWGLQTIDEYVAADGRTVLSIPHLSRFRIFGGRRTAAAAAVGETARRVLG